MRAVQLCASTRLRCTPVWKVSSHPYSCTDQVVQFVRVYTPYTLKVTPLSHHEQRRRPARVPRALVALLLSSIRNRRQSYSGASMALRRGCCIARQLTAQQRPSRCACACGAEPSVNARRCRCCFWCMPPLSDVSPRRCDAYRGLLSGPVPPRSAACARAGSSTSSCRVTTVCTLSHLWPLIPVEGKRCRSGPAS
jgi:hypothetical protein